MKAFDLERIFVRSQHNLTDADISDLGAAGISALSVGVEHVAIKRGGFWERSFNGERVFITPCHSPTDDDYCDLIAFRLETPNIFWRYTGFGVMLGYWNARDADYFKTPLFLHQSPYHWLRAGQDGCCILDWKHYWPGVFGNAASVRVSDLQFGDRVERLLAKPFPCPPVQVPV